MKDEKFGITILTKYHIFIVNILDFICEFPKLYVFPQFDVQYMLLKMICGLKVNPVDVTSLLEYGVRLGGGEGRDVLCGRATGFYEGGWTLVS